MIHEIQLSVDGSQPQEEEGNVNTAAPKPRRTFWFSDGLNLIKRVGRDVTFNWKGTNQKGKLKYIEAAYKEVMIFDSLVARQAQIRENIPIGRDAIPDVVNKVDQGVGRGIPIPRIPNLEVASDAAEEID